MRRPSRACARRAPCCSAKPRRRNSAGKARRTSPLTGITRNPWNKDKTPGGSSGGSSAALAARFAPLALGTDGGGSIRIPASFTGTYGLKPSFGRVPAYPLSPFGTVAHVGPMSRDGARQRDDDERHRQTRCARLVQRAGRKRRTTPRDSSESMKGKRIAFSPRLGYAKRVDCPKSKRWSQPP